MNFDASVGIVAYPAGDAQQVCLALDKPPEPYTLHTSRNQEASSLGGIGHETVVSGQSLVVRKIPHPSTNNVPGWGNPIRSLAKERGKMRHPGQGISNSNSTIAP